MLKNGVRSGDPVAAIKTFEKNVSHDLRGYDAPGVRAIACDNDIQTIIMFDDCCRIGRLVERFEALSCPVF